ncbi:hypothetical protein AB0P37_08515 [Streptomyces antimycoticus]|uniref:hypothetical protein n=1 Tax=Streptomyces antimycoticus TaxID=68175 RepID=UPI0034236E5C
MSKRGVVSDFRGQEVRTGDIIVYAARHGNTVRMSEGEVLDVTTEKYKGRLIPSIKVRPTGRASGFVARESVATVNILADHWAVVERAEDLA